MTTGTNTLANHRQPCKQCRPIEKIKTHKNLACSRLRDSRVRWIEKANTKIKQVETGESAPPTFRVPFSFASSPQSESLEQANKIPASNKNSKKNPYTKN